MSEVLTVGKLREALIGIPDDLPVVLLSDSGVDQGMGEIVVEAACRVCYPGSDYFSIYTNDHLEDDDIPDCEGLSDEDIERIIGLINEANKLLKRYEE